MGIGILIQAQTAVKAEKVDASEAFKHALLIEEHYCINVGCT